MSNTEKQFYYEEQAKLSKLHMEKYPDYRCVSSSAYCFQSKVSPTIFTIYKLCIVGIVPDPKELVLLTGRSCECRSTNSWWRHGGRRWDSCGVRMVKMMESAPVNCLRCLRRSSQTQDIISVSVLLFHTDLQVRNLFNIPDFKAIFTCFDII